MTVVQMRRKAVQTRPTSRKSVIRRSKRVYAIAFDLDTAIAEKMCGPNFRGVCYPKIAAVMAEHGFNRQQGSLYFGDEDSDAVKCFMVVRDLDDRFAWFGRAVRDLRMLRVDEDSDMMPILSNRLRLESTGT